MGVRDFDSYRIYNPAAGNVYFDTAGSAISSQPKVDGGAATMSSGTRSNLDGVVIFGTQRDIYGAQLTADLAGSGQGTAAISGRDFGKMTAGRWVMRRGGANANWIAGSADTTLRSAASDYGLRRTVKRRDSVRGPLTATAIRHGLWHEFSGIWVTGTLTYGAGGLAQVTANLHSSPPTSTNGLGNVAGAATGGLDKAAMPSGSKPGEFVYYFGSGDLALRDDYNAKTTW